ncbi:right-handed parallel beta-helix repeat-containing protein [Marivirga sp.]|uniref:right-handed parallel beta-helix repeat-containing protein n=1 Tax=Marivirga sp. TaxID=2018662 RepID=UPI0025E07256|nr:right-handed parallel beta-helix repeat-containing protein [Marivirga sp.]
MNGIKKNFRTVMQLMSILIIIGLFFSCERVSEEGLIADDKVDLPEVSEVLDCGECTYIVNEHETNGKELNIQPGDVICLESGRNYGPLLFKNIVGTMADPVIIKNCGGVATIDSDGSFGMKFQNSKHFKLLGDGSKEKYGIKVSTSSGFFVMMEYFTNSFTISQIEVAGKEPGGRGENSGFSGIGIKTSPYQDCDLFTDETRQAWIMKDIEVSNNYIHDTGGEGLYVGHGFYAGRKEKDCGQVTYSHSIQNIRIFDNIIENVGFDGIQIKNADRNVEVFDNQIRGFGLRDHGAHNEGLFIGEGSTGQYYNNLIMDGTGNGIQYQGMGNVDIFNNVIVNAKGNGFFGAHGQFVYRIPNGYHNILNNTFVNIGEVGFTFYNDDGGVKRLMNNVFAGVGGDMTSKGAELDSANNLFTQDVESLGFVDVGNGKLRLKSDSPLIDAGIDETYELGVIFDYKDDPRPAGSSVDIGAFEYQQD